MSDLTFTLLGDGPTDEALLPILVWLLRQHLPETPLNPQFVAAGEVGRPLVRAVPAALKLYPCDLLLVHRDAENRPSAERRQEIDAATRDRATPQYVRVVPVRMTEAWLLFDEPAIRAASGNPNGNVALDLPRVRDLENIIDPKTQLRDTLRTASGLRGRRLRNAPLDARRVADLISDFSPLRLLAAFQQLEDDVEVFTARWRATAPGGC